MKKLLLIVFILSFALGSCKRDNTDDIDPNDIYLSTNELYFESNESSETITVTSANSWTVQNDAEEWCTVSPTYADKTSAVVVSVIENDTDEDRETTITFTAGNKTAKLSITQYKAVATNYVAIDWDNTTISGYNSESGDMTLSVSDGVDADFATNQVLVMPGDYGYEVRVIKSSSVSGSDVTLSTTQGNMSNLFRDIEFTLMTNESKAVSMTRSSGRRIATPVEIGVRSKDGEYKKVYSKSDAATRGDYSYTDRIIALGDDYSGTEVLNEDGVFMEFEKGVFDIGLDAVFEFSFGSDFSNEMQFLGSLEDFKFYLDGNIDIDLLARYIIEGEYSAGTDMDEDVDYIKKNLIHDIELKFTIGTVPVVIVVSTHLCKIASVEAESQIEFTTGGYLHSAAQIGLHYTGSNTEPFETFELDYGLYDPVLTANGSVTAIGSLYPKFDFSIYNILGPWVEPMPYLKEEIEVGMKYTGDASVMRSTSATSDSSASATRDYYGWKSEGYSGMMYRVGLELSCFGYTNEIYKSDVIEAQEKLLFEVPSKIELVSPSNSVDIVAGETYTATFQTLYYNGITDEYSPCAGAVVSDDDSSFMISDTNGKISTQWTAESIYDVTYMEIVDSEDDTISSESFPSNDDRESLIKLYNSAGGANWTRNDNWCTDAPLNEWYGIYADSDDHVTSIVLSVYEFQNLEDGQVDASHTVVGNNMTGDVVISGFKYLTYSRNSPNIMLYGNEKIENIELSNTPNISLYIDESTPLLNNFTATNCYVNDSEYMTEINVKEKVIITNSIIDGFCFSGSNVEISGSEIDPDTIYRSLSGSESIIITNSEIDGSVSGNDVDISASYIYGEISGPDINITDCTIDNINGTATAKITGSSCSWVSSPFIELTNSTADHYISGDVYLLSNSNVGDYYFSYFYGTSGDYAELFR